MQIILSPLGHKDRTKTLMENNEICLHKMENFYILRQQNQN